MLWLSLSGTLCGAINIASGFVTSFEVFLCGLCVRAALLSSMFPAIDSILSTLYSRERQGAIFGLHGSICMCGVVVFTLLPHVVIEPLVGADRAWRASFVVVGIGHGVGSLLLMLAYQSHACVCALLPLVGCLPSARLPLSG